MQPAIRLQRLLVHPLNLQPETPTFFPNAFSSRLHRTTFKFTLSSHRRGQRPHAHRSRHAGLARYQSAGPAGGDAVVQVRLLLLQQRWVCVCGVT